MISLSVPGTINSKIGNLLLIFISFFLDGGNNLPGGRSAQFHVLARRSRPGSITIVIGAAIEGFEFNARFDDQMRHVSDILTLLHL